MIKASIIVPTMNRAKLLKIALGSFVRQDCPKQSFEILIVDNGSADHTKSVVESAMAQNLNHTIRYIFEPVPGLLSGRHRGAQEARGDILVFVDDDIEAFPNWLSSVIETFNDPFVHLVGGPSMPRFEADPPNWMDRFMVCKNGRIRCGELSLFDIGNQTRTIEPTYVWGLNFSIRKQTLFDLGGFHPDCIPKKLQHFQGDGETGLALKLRKKGLAAVYAGGARVIHHIPRERLTVAYFEKRYFYQGVCDSYTRIRELRKVTDAIDFKPIGAVAAQANEDSLYQQYRRIVYKRIQDAYTAGFLFHHKAVKADPQLLDWVLREDYFDYRLPGVNSQRIGRVGNKFRNTIRRQHFSMASQKSPAI